MRGRMANEGRIDIELGLRILKIDHVAASCAAVAWLHVKTIRYVTTLSRNRQNHLAYQDIIFQSILEYRLRRERREMMGPRSQNPTTLTQPTQRRSSSVVFTSPASSLWPPAFPSHVVLCCRRGCKALSELTCAAYVECVCVPVYECVCICPSVFLCCCPRWSV